MVGCIGADGRPSVFLHGYLLLDRRDCELEIQGLNSLPQCDGRGLRLGEVGRLGADDVVTSSKARERVGAVFVGGCGLRGSVRGSGGHGRTRHDGAARVGHHSMQHHRLRKQRRYHTQGQQQVAQRGDQLTSLISRSYGSILKIGLNRDSRSEYGQPGNLAMAAALDGPHRSPASKSSRSTASSDCAGRLKNHLPFNTKASHN